MPLVLWNSGRTALDGMFPDRWRKTLKTTIEIRTESVLNKREHWRRRAERTREHRWATGVSLQSTKTAPVLPCTILLTRIAPRPLDDDNLRGALKAVRDGVADWLGLDDRDSRVTWDYEQRRGPTKYYAVEVAMTAQGEAA
ncbi:hypothetical protein [Variovorax sp. GT1P44]|uniref:hypothetical protein n=1 Tax=Variovorax sp. GT1P44 TaxID=3443742 RepID=UPI003F4715C1